MYSNIDNEKIESFILFQFAGRNETVIDKTIPLSEYLDSDERMQNSKKSLQPHSIFISIIVNSGSARCIGKKQVLTVNIKTQFSSQLFFVQKIKV